MTDKKVPTIGESVFVWPRHRTVRDEQRKPITDGDGAVKKKPARVRDGAGALITGRKFVKVDLQIVSQIQRGNLDWCSREEQRKHLLEKTQKSALAKKPEGEKQSSIKESVPRKEKTTQSAGVENPAN